jgi:hypothetical protein
VAFTSTAFSTVIDGYVEWYTGTNIGIAPYTINGPGTFKDWSISLTGARGFQGFTGATGPAGATGAIANPLSSVFTITNTTSATSTNSGALQVVGGAGIGGNLHVGGNISVNNSQAVNGPAFSVYPDSGVTQTITSGTQQKVLFQLEDFDTNGNFASSRFTPTVAGYYQLNAAVRISGTMGTGESMLVIWKNGSEYKRGWNASGTEVGASFFSMGVSTIAYANGTGDYFEVYIQQTSGSSKDITVAGGNITWFNGCMMRGA